MSRVLWIDAQVGVAGDMLLAACLDAGASEDAVRSGLVALGLPETWTMHAAPVRRGAFRARRVVFEVDGHETDDGAHSHAHNHDAHDAHGHGAWRDIRQMLERAPIADRAKARALAAYSRLAEAEATLHGVDVQDVVLHEVGSTDAILDIVGTALALEDLGIDALVATSLPLGAGGIHAAHGHLSLPAPATLALCVGWPVTAAHWPGEWVTPTGAALVTSLATPGGFPAGVPRAVGHGAGKRNPEFVANLVRVAVVETGDAVRSEAVELVCNLDDATGEMVSAATAEALSHGAFDAWVVPVVMKKGRAGLVVHVLCAPGDEARLTERLLRGTPTLGVRRYDVLRTVLDRWFVEVTTPWGTVRVKVGGRDGEAFHAAPEFDDVARVAERSGVPTLAVWSAAMAAWGGGCGG